jgi:hypothetical protein
MASTRTRGPGRPPKLETKRGPGRPPSAETIRKRRLLERAAKRAEALAARAGKRGPGRPRKDGTPARRKAVTPVARAARKRNAALGGRPGRVCLHCLAPVLGGHRDKRRDATCGTHGYAWRPPAGLTPAEIRQAITDEIAALHAALYRFGTAEAGRVDVDAVAGANRATGQETHAPGLRRASKAPPAGQAPRSEAIATPAIPPPTSESEAATEAPGVWRGYDANGECLDCDELADAHAADCPYWTQRQDVPTERTTEAEATHVAGGL